MHEVIVDEVTPSVGFRLQSAGCSDVRTMAFASNVVVVRALREQDIPLAAYLK